MQVGEISETQQFWFFEVSVKTSIAKQIPELNEKSEERCKLNYIIKSSVHFI